ncbi:MAG: hypothetical protein OEZ39_18420 [Gammaproteobacteria bacterium]|nr:hypothetical protein [Gammaproteobacteria bacterium]MDH5653843.1 hypothetical protein [Gammaproteobacteria bacterium]
MSMDFTFVLVGPIQPLNELMLKIDAQVKDIGFRKSGSIYKVELDERDVFEENEKFEIIGKEISECQPELKDWKGLAVEYTCPEYTIYLLMGNCNDRYLNCFMDISDKVLDRLIAEDEINSYLRFITTVAVNAKSQGGFGTFEQPFTPIAPDKTIPYIFNNPAGTPSLLGMIPYSAYEEDEIRDKAGDDYRVSISTQGYYLLEHRDFRL